ncbi:zinc finger C2HC domain-containing protein 1B isoform X4 [Notamacropus eugenii]|uniref:zinc finger C2HC domain-containing protein 1B isoform X4 n=1 Tax=Notamacropus eugenii TaxID=9315 RepID=UPI003B683BCA
MIISSCVHNQHVSCNCCVNLFSKSMGVMNGMLGKKPFPSDGNLKLYRCDVCGRSFAPDVLMPPVKKSSWRQQHEDLINAIRAAKQCFLAIKEGRPLPPPPPPTINPDYIQCPYCMRRFNETAAARHINFCKDQASRRVFNPAQTAAKIASRAQNKAQLVPKKESTTTSAVGTLLQNRAVDPSSDHTKGGPSSEARTGLKVKKPTISKKN